MENNQMIFHILQAGDWEKAKEIGLYAPESLEFEGFIHCSTRAQVVQTANSFFKGQSNLVLLWIETEKVQPEIRYEDLAGEGTLFPHIYGPLNLDAVAHVSRLPIAENGRFIFPISRDGSEEMTSA